MKKIVAILMGIILIAGLCSCESKPSTINTTDETAKIKTTEEKINGKIVSISEFSEGLCFACTGRGENDCTYCIDCDGNIKFKLEENLGANYWNMREKFINGIAIIYNYNGAGCYAVSKTGKIITPEDVGATGFYPDALSEGYILASRITSTYDSTKQELGIMNLNYKWIVEPNEQLYNDCYNEEYSNMLGPHLGIGYKNYATNKKLFIEINTEIYYCLNLQSGKVEKNIKKDDLPISLNYVDKIDISKHSNAYFALHNSLDYLPFENKYEVVLFFNQSSQKGYFTLIDEKGNFLFEPIEYGNKEMKIGDFDGNTIMLSEVSFGSSIEVQTFTMKGEKIAESTLKGNGPMLREGKIITHNGSGNNSECYVYSADLSLLL